MTGMVLFSFLLIELAWFVPFRKVFSIAHFHPAYAFLSLLPLIGPLLCLWILAIKPWPLKRQLIRHTV